MKTCIMENLERWIRLPCDCVNPPDSLRQFVKNDDEYRIMTEPLHELSLTTYYPDVKYRCSSCGNEKNIKVEE